MLRILIADDDVDYCAAFADGLGQFGYEVEAVHNGMEVIDTIESDSFDVVFLDIFMPGGGAVSLAHEISSRFPELPMIVISGQELLYETPIFQKGLRHARAVLRKSASLREIRDAISNAIV